MLAGMTRPSVPAKAHSDRHTNTQQGIFSSSLLSVGASLITVGDRAGRGILHAVSAGYDHLTCDQSDRENVLFVKFSHLELKSTAGLQQIPVLLLGYDTGFQVWDLHDRAQIRELASRRDGAIRQASVVLLALCFALSFFSKALTASVLDAVF